MAGQRKGERGTPAVRITVRLPRWLLDDLRKYVPARRRSEVIAAATAEAMARIKLDEALRIGAGAWSDEDHPDLRTQKDVNRYLSELRMPAAKRFRQNEQ